MSPFARHALSAALALSFNLLPSAHAVNVITENFTFSGGGATATGHITFDTDVYEVTNGNMLGFTDVHDFSVEVTGAGAGNGIFGLTDFEDLNFYSPSAFDWTTSLIGQQGFGLDTITGNTAFYFYKNGLTAKPNAPTSTNFFTLTTSTGQSMQLTSMVADNAAPVPEPETYMLMGLASAALAYTRRRNSKKQQSTAQTQPLAA